MTKPLTLEDLAIKTGLSLRTLRFYMQEGLLQGPETHGKYASYSPEHLARLKMIQRLKDLHLPLQEIRELLNNMTSDDVSQMLGYQSVIMNKLMDSPALDQGQASSIQTGESALEYIYKLEHRMDTVRSLKSTSNARQMNTSPVASTEHEMFMQNYDMDTEVESNTKGNELWSRIVIQDGIEINTRQSNDPMIIEKVTKLIDFATHLFGDQSKKEQ